MKISWGTVFVVIVALVMVSAFGLLIHSFWEMQKIDLTLDCIKSQIDNVEPLFDRLDELNQHAHLCQDQQCVEFFANEMNQTATHINELMSINCEQLVQEALQ